VEGNEHVIIYGIILKFAYEGYKNYGNLEIVRVSAEIWNRHLSKRRAAVPLMSTCRTWRTGIHLSYTWNWAPTSRRIQPTFIINTILGELFVVCTGNWARLTSALCRHNEAFLNVSVDGTYSNHETLKSYKLFFST